MDPAASVYDALFHAHTSPSSRGLRPVPADKRTVSRCKKNKNKSKNKDKKQEEARSDTIERDIPKPKRKHTIQKEKDRKSHKKTRDNKSSSILRIGIDFEVYWCGSWLELWIVASAAPNITQVSASSRGLSSGNTNKPCEVPKKNKHEQNQ